MVQYILVAVAALLVVNGSSIESLSASGQIVDYVVAIGVALMLKPWLQGHFE
jgi:hypothetical protein